jgi:hypothetical protein
VWTFDPGEEEEGSGPNSPYVQEHIDLIKHIRGDEPINEAQKTAISTLTAIMGRMAAYTGKEVTWDEMMSSDLAIGPEELEGVEIADYELGEIDLDQFSVPVPGAEKT